MRLWCPHPSYLDSKGLIAFWREGLLARKVLCGETRGYKNPPQLERFKVQANPVAVLDSYLAGILEEAARRGFAFNPEKIGPLFSDARITVTNGQLEYELSHLKTKLRAREPKQYEKIAKILSPQAHPLFEVIKGSKEYWERTTSENPLKA